MIFYYYFSDRAISSELYLSLTIPSQEDPSPFPKGKEKQIPELNFYFLANPYTSMHSTNMPVLEKQNSSVTKKSG